MSKYIHGERSKTLIIQTGLLLWHEAGVGAVTARGIGKRIGLSHAGVIYHFGGVAEMLREIKEEAIRSGDRKIIPQLITSGDPLVAGWSQADRQGWLMAGG